MEEKKGEHPLGDIGQVFCLLLYLVVWAADSFWLRFSTQASGSVPLLVRLGLAAACLAAGCFLFSSGHRVVHNDERGKRILRDGAFRYVRHPLYLAGVLFYVALTVATASIISLALMIVIFAFYDHIAGYEEDLLEEKFGDGYREYMKRTGKWLPKRG